MSRPHFRGSVIMAVVVAIPLLGNGAAYGRAQEVETATNVAFTDAGPLN